MSKVSALYHIVWCTKNRQMTLTDKYREDVYRFVWNEVKKQKCRLIRIGGIENHLHLLIDLNPTVALSELVGSVKAATSAWLNRDSRFPDFGGWAKEYFATTISVKDSQSVILYINSQQEHHKGTDFSRELESLHRSAGVEYYEKSMTD